jgi:hypothetical protein
MSGPTGRSSQTKGAAAHWLHDLHACGLFPERPLTQAASGWLAKAGDWQEKTNGFTDQFLFIAGGGRRADARAVCQAGLAYPGSYAIPQEQKQEACGMSKTGQPLARVPRRSQHRAWLLPDHKQQRATHRDEREAFCL